MHKLLVFLAACNRSDEYHIVYFQLNYYSLLLLETTSDDLVNFKPNSISMIFLRHENPEINIDVSDQNLLEISVRRMNIVKEKVSDSLDEQIINRVNCHSLVIPI